MFFIMFIPPKTVIFYFPYFVNQFQWTIAHNVPAVYEMCRIAHFTYIQDIASGVISLPYNELALPV
jgi:hypothetical protein